MKYTSPRWLHANPPAEWPRNCPCVPSPSALCRELGLRGLRLGGPRHELWAAQGIGCQEALARGAVALGAGQQEREGTCLELGEPGLDQAGRAPPAPCPRPPSVAYPLPRASSARSVEAQNHGNRGDPESACQKWGWRGVRPPPPHAPGAPARHGDHLLSLTSLSSSPRSPQPVSSPEPARHTAKCGVGRRSSADKPLSQRLQGAQVPAPPPPPRP